MGKIILVWLITFVAVSLPVGYWIRWVLKPITKELQEININLTRIRTLQK